MGYPIHGKVTRIEKNAQLTDNTLGFEITTGLTLEDITAQGAHWKAWLAGLAEWGGVMHCMFDPSSTEQKALMDNIVAATPGTKLTDLEFNLEDTADYFSGNLFITSMPVTANIGGKVTCDFEFKGDGALSLTIA